MTFLHAVKQSLVGTALPYGFAVSVTTSLQALAHMHHTPNIGQLYLFVAGVGAAYGSLRLVTHDMEPVGDIPSETDHPVRAGAIHLGGIALGLGTAALVGQISGWIVWPAGAFLATSVYLLVNALEPMLQATRDG